MNRNRKKQILYGFIAFFVISLIACAVIIRNVYQTNLNPLNNSDSEIVVTIEPGSPPSKIADTLVAKDVIKSDWAFEWYVRNHNYRDELKAGTYVLKSSQSIPEIVDIIRSGKVATDLVTILPGKRIDQVKADLVKAGFTEAEVDLASNPANYKDHPALTDKPKEASLEGYLYPESFQKTAETTAQQIIGLSLDEMNRYLTPEIRQGFAKQGLTVHEGITLASIVEQEVSKASDKPTVAQVFLKRYKTGMMLGADPTALYGSIIAGEEPSLFYDSPYNTRMHAGLPPGPIGNVSESSLKAVADPSETDWLFFVAGDDGVTYFSKTLEEHEALTKQHCVELCKSY
ncbi:endolytic transglycosylase MltG [Candidatus Saccharibacteria bacterium]|nr:endolytic transglycosylase MltG [Candidatus Saccharibacteria bacterium]